MTFSALHVGVLLLVASVVWCAVGWCCGAHRLKKTTKERDVLRERLLQRMLAPSRRRTS